MDEGKEVKKPTDSLIADARRELIFGVPVNTAFTRRGLAAAITSLPTAQKAQKVKKTSK